MRSRFAASFALTALACLAAPAAAQSRVDTCGELVVYNGKIITGDARDTTASSVVIKDGVFAAVGTGRTIPKHSACARMIDAGGRLVIPGLVDNHSHILAVGLRPGHDIRLDLAESMADIQQLVRARAQKVPAGEFITAIGGFHTNQFREKRLPTLAELDQAAPNHPVFVCLAFTGPGVANTRGKAFFESQAVAVAADGRVAANAPALAALNALRATQTFDDLKRNTLNALNYVAAQGVTIQQDNAGGWPANVQGAQGIAALGNGATNEMDPYTAYNPLLALYREGKLPTRMRILFASRDTTLEVPLLKQRLNNAYRDFGDDWLKVSGVGEWITAYNIGAPPPPNYETAVRAVAEAGWIYQQHTGGIEDERAMTEIWERVNRTTPLAPLRWNLAHVPGITKELLDRLKVLGVGTGVGGNRYLAATAATKGPPFRMIVDSGIHTGYGIDGGSISPVNPWVHVQYLVTGKNSAGELIEPGQQITRRQALGLFGAQNGWFLKEEGKVGSIEPGKYGDLAILNQDFLDPAKVPDEAIKRTTAVLTIIGGKIVHDAGIIRSK
jgi:hypothetical protein